MINLEVVVQSAGRLSGLVFAHHQTDYITVYIYISLEMCQRCNSFFFLFLLIVEPEMSKLRLLRLSQLQRDKHTFIL